MTTVIPSAPQRWLDALRLFSLYGLAICLFSAPAGVSAGLTLIWIWLAGLLLSRPRLPTNPVLWLVMAFALYCLIQASFTRVAGLPLGRQWEAAFSWAQLAVMVPIAYALWGDERLILRLLLLTLIGLLLGTLWRLDWAMLMADTDAFLRSRPGFGFPALGYALYAGTALIGLLALRQRCWYRADGRLRWWAIPLWLVAVALLAQGVVLTQSRGSWLGLILVGLLGAGLWIGARWRARRRGQARPIPRLPLLAVALGLLLLIGLNGGEIRDRLGEEQEVAEQLLRGEVPADQISSITLRWHAQRFGLAQWLQRPWFGWGPGASHQLMTETVAESAAEDGRPRGTGLWHPLDGVLKHLHNSYLELLTQLGLVGFGLWMTIGLMLLWPLYDAVRRAQLSADLGLFLILALLYLALWSLFNFRMVHQDFRGYWALLGGAALSIGLYRRGAVDGSRDCGDG